MISLFHIDQSCLAAIAEVVTTIDNFLTGDDCFNTMKNLSAMGVKIECLNEKSSQLRVYGVGKKGLRAPEKILDCGNSGTTLRLMMGLLLGKHL